MKHQHQFVWNGHHGVCRFPGCQAVLATSSPYLITGKLQRGDVVTEPVRDEQLEQRVAEFVHQWRRLKKLVRPSRR